MSIAQKYNCSAGILYYKQYCQYSSVETGIYGELRLTVSKMVCSIVQW